jgi:hypothetical protein
MKCGNLPVYATSAELLAYLKAQIVEMEKYKWILGVHLGHDPLLDRSLNEIYCDWIHKHGPAFRVWWESRENNVVGGK